MSFSTNHKNYSIISLHGNVGHHKLRPIVGEHAKCLRRHVMLAAVYALQVHMPSKTCSHFVRRERNQSSCSYQTIEFHPLSIHAPWLAHSKKKPKVSTVTVFKHTGLNQSFSTSTLLQRPWPSVASRCRTFLPAQAYDLFMIMKQWMSAFSLCQVILLTMRPELCRLWRRTVWERT